MYRHGNVTISDSIFVKAMNSPKTRAALVAKAKEKQARAEQIANSEDVELDSSIVVGTRPAGRPYARVQSRNVAQEYGNSKTKRRRILGRAAEF